MSTLAPLTEPQALEGETHLTPTAIDSFADLERELPAYPGSRFDGINPAVYAGGDLTALPWFRAMVAPHTHPMLRWVAVAVQGGQCETNLKPYAVGDVAHALNKMGATDSRLVGRPFAPSASNPFVVPDRPAGPKRFGARAVYFIQPVGGGLIKIGVSNSPISRLEALQVGCPVDLKIIGLIPDAEPGTEAALHARFAHARVRGEWFEPVPELLRFIGEATR